MNPVKPFSFWGKIIVLILRWAYKLVGLFIPELSNRPLKGHHEDPLKMTLKEKLWLGYKYYAQPIYLPESDDQLPQYFADQSKKFIKHSETHWINSITLSSGGDLMPYKEINTTTCAHLWDEVGPWFFDADIVTANLETPLVKVKKKSTVPEVMLNHMYFNADEEMFKVFEGLGNYKGYDVLSFANNHSLDQGEEGIQQTLNYLNQKNIQYCGAFSNPNQPICNIQRNGINVGFIGATFSLNNEVLNHENQWMINHINLNEPNPNIEILVHQAKQARDSGVDFLVAHLHMGCAYQAWPSDVIMVNIKEIVEKTGIDLIIANHPHNPMPLAFHNILDPFSNLKKQCCVFYSLGDFVAYDIHKWCHLPLLAKIEIGQYRQDQTLVTAIKNIDLKLCFTYALIQKNKIKSLQFIEYNKLIANNTLLDQNAQKELEELREFVDNHLLPGNIGDFIS